MNVASLLTILLLLGSTLGLMAGAKISGSTEFQFSAGNGEVTFGCGGINNPSKENATGTLMVRLWALESPYQGGGINGKIVATYKLDGLNPGSHYSNVSKTVKTTLPGRRAAYVLCLTVMEYQGGEYVVTDYRNFSGSTVLAPPPLFTMKAPWRWQSSTEGGTVELEVASITHTRAGSTGSLKLAVWATDAPYAGGSLRGYQLGFVKKDALKTGYSYNKVKNTAKYARPPAGRYYVNLILSEFDDGEYRIVSWLGGSTRVDFK